MARSWTYAAHGAREVGRPAAAADALPWHFHDEAQIVIVTAGWRAFRTPAGVLRAGPGEAVVLPARLPHASEGGAGSVVENHYLPPDDPAARRLHSPGVIGWPRGGDLDSVSAAAAGSAAAFSAVAEGMMETVTRGAGDLRAAARRHGYSPDGFTRAFRRLVGMTPAAFRVAHRLTVARAALRAGCSPAEAAYASGFADQSHLGRAFVRAYGVTPAAYRAVFAAGRNRRFRSRRPGG